ncbi:HNH endonuclease [Streptomyces sp. IBSBF 2950]|uniref:HNH endonuclease n=1 Tax=Streptomyces sp. IBSBF 2950 TaxID=2903528 RepID=UPI002FDC38FF
MWPLDPPAVSSRHSYETCVGSTRDPGRRELLLAAADSVEGAGDRFRSAAHQNTLHALDSTAFSIPGISAADAVAWAYDRGMVATKSGRVIYDQIMSAPPEQRCPLCGHGVVRTLDHVLPKKAFPALCVDPLNLVPACADCNHAKGEARPSSAETTPLHPYLDRIDHDPWLDARIMQSSPIWLEFFVSPPPSWDHVLTDRARHHFELFGLSELFAIQANRTLSSIRHQLAELKSGNAEVVRAYLSDEAATRLAHRPNGWEGVTYRTLAGDDRFCNGDLSL